MSEKVHIEFNVADGKREEFLHWLSAVTGGGLGHAADHVEGFRADDQVERRAALRLFVDQMELKLRKNEHKSNWKEKPIEALFKLLLLEIEEFKVAYEFFGVNEARPELVDVANFALICWDRLGMLDQRRNAKEQQAEIDRMLAMQNSYKP